MSYSEFLGDLLASTGVDIQMPIQDLLNGREVCSRIYDSISFADLKDDLTSIYTFMYYIGYLTVTGAPKGSGQDLYSLRIPNMEIRGWYEDILKQSAETVSDTAAIGVDKDKPVDIGNDRENKSASRNDHSENDKYSCILE